MTFYNAGVQQAEITNFPATQPVSGNVGITGTPNVNVTGNPVVVPKTTMGTITTAAIPTATPFTETAIDFGATMTYTTFRVRVIFDQPVKVEFYHGSSATLTSNKIQRTDTIPANTPTVIDYPILARYGGIKITNTGAATTTISESIYALFS